MRWTYTPHTRPLGDRDVLVERSHAAFYKSRLAQSRTHHHVTTHKRARNQTNTTHEYLAALVYTHTHTHPPTHTQTHTRTRTEKLVS